MSLLLSFTNLSFVIGVLAAIIRMKGGEHHIFLPPLIENPGFSSPWSDVMSFWVSASYSISSLLCAYLASLLRGSPSPNPHTATNQQNKTPNTTKMKESLRFSHQNTITQYILPWLLWRGKAVKTMRSSQNQFEALPVLPWAFRG